MALREAQVDCPVCRHRYYPEDKSTYRVCTKCDEKICTTCASRDLWKCTMCRHPYATLEQVA